MHLLHYLLHKKKQSTEEARVSRESAKAFWLHKDQNYNSPTLMLTFPRFLDQWMCTFLADVEIPRVCCCVVSFFPQWLLWWRIGWGQGLRQQCSTTEKMTEGLLHIKTVHCTLLEKYRKTFSGCFFTFRSWCYLDLLMFVHYGKQTAVQGGVTRGRVWLLGEGFALLQLGSASDPGWKPGFSVSE